jgi:hypothetical protein
MRKITLGVLFIMASLIMIAQEKQQEVGIAFRDLNNFGFTYKSVNSTALWRYNILSGNLWSTKNKSENSTYESNSFSFSASIEKEIRKLITKNLEYRYGADVAFSYGYSKNDSNGEFTSKISSYSPSINAVTGLNYLFNKHIALGIELLPAISYAFGTQENENNIGITKSESQSWGAGFQNNSARLSLPIGFKKNLLNHNRLKNHFLGDFFYWK